MGNQQHIAAIGKLAQGLPWITIGSQPRHADEFRGETQGIAYQLSGLLSPNVRACQNAVQWLIKQPGSTVQNLFTPFYGQLALGITSCVGLGLTMAQDPDFHGLVSAPPVGATYGTSPSGARGAGQSANGQGFCSV